MQLCGFSSAQQCHITALARLQGARPALNLHATNWWGIWSQLPCCSPSTRPAARTVVALGLLGGSRKPGPAPLHGGMVGPQGVIVISCQRPCRAPHPRSSLMYWYSPCTGMCLLALSHQNSLVRSFQCQPSLLPSMLVCGMLLIQVNINLCMNTQGSRLPCRLLPILSI